MDGFAERKQELATAFSLMENKQYDQAIKRANGLLKEATSLKDTINIRAAYQLIANGKSGVPIIAMTANVMKEEVGRCYQAGMNDFIGKPFDTSLLLEKSAGYGWRRGVQIRRVLTSLRSKNRYLTLSPKK